MKETINFEYRVFGEIKSKTRNHITTLDRKFPEDPNHPGPFKMFDEYIWCEGCQVNTKVRKDKLKFKFLGHRTSDYIETWRVNDKIPIDINGRWLKSLEKYLVTTAPGFLINQCKNSQDLMKNLSSFNPSLQCVIVEKLREQYIKKVAGHKITIEIAEIKKPINTESICIEFEFKDIKKLDYNILNVSLRPDTYFKL